MIGFRRSWWLTKLLAATISPVASATLATLEMPRRNNAIPVQPARATHIRLCRMCLIGILQYANFRPKIFGVVGFTVLVAYFCPQCLLGSSPRLSKLTLLNERWTRVDSAESMLIELAGGYGWWQVHPLLSRSWCTHRKHQLRYADKFCNLWHAVKSIYLGFGMEHGDTSF